MADAQRGDHAQRVRARVAEDRPERAASVPSQGVHNASLKHRFVTTGRRRETFGGDVR